MSNDYDLAKYKNITDDWDKFLALALEGLTVIGQVIGGATAGRAADVLTVVQVILRSIDGAYQGTVTVDKVRSEWAKLTASIAGNDARADAALRRRFGDGDNGK